MTASSSPDAVPGEEFEYVQSPARLGKEIDMATATKLYHPIMALATTCSLVHSQALRYEEMKS
jgi:hypothetical protein